MLLSIHTPETMKLSRNPGITTLHHIIRSNHERPGLLLVGHVGEDLVSLEHVPHPLRVPVQPRPRETSAKGW